jgi:hypothetical protein
MFRYNILPKQIITLGKDILVLYILSFMTIVSAVSSNPFTQTAIRLADFLNLMCISHKEVISISINSVCSLTFVLYAN